MNKMARKLITPEEKKLIEHWEKIYGKRAAINFKRGLLSTK
jgi:hypothetical protein